MEAKNEKISLNQLLVVFFISCAAPAIRLVPSFIAERAENASIIAPFLFSITGLILVLIIGKIVQIMKQKNTETFYELINKTFGGFLGKIIITVYVIWLFVATAIQLRTFAERMINNLFIYSKAEFFIVCMLAVVYILCRYSFKKFARFCNVLDKLFWIAFFVVTLSSMQTFDVDNLMPITLYDLPKAIEGSVIITAIFSSQIYLLFIWDKVDTDNGFFKAGKNKVIAFILAASLSIICTIGCYGYTVVSTLPQPFFVAIKGNKFFGLLEGTQSIFTAFWLMLDFVFIRLYVTYMSTIIKKLFNLKSENAIISPIIFLIYFLSFTISSNFLDMTYISEIMVPLLLIPLSYGIPLIIIFINKIKSKKLPTI